MPPEDKDEDAEILDAWQQPDVAVAPVVSESAKNAPRGNVAKSPGRPKEGGPKPSRSSVLAMHKNRASRAFKKRDVEQDIEPLPPPSKDKKIVKHELSQMKAPVEIVKKIGPIANLQGPPLDEMSVEERKDRAIIRMTAYLAAGYSKASACQRVGREFKIESTIALNGYYNAALSNLVPDSEGAKNRLRAHIHGMGKQLFRIAVARKDVKGGVAIMDRLSKLFDLDMTPGPTNVVNVGTMQIADMRGDVRKDDFLARARKVGIDTSQAEQLLQIDDELQFDNMAPSQTQDMRGSYSADVVSGLEINGEVVAPVATDDSVSELQRYHQEKQGVKIVDDKVVPLFGDKT